MITALVLDAWLRAPPPRMAVGDVRPRGRVGGVVRAAKQLRSHTPARPPPTLPERPLQRARRAAQRGDAAAALSIATDALAAHGDADAVDARECNQLVRELNQLLRELGDQKRLREAERVFRRLVAAGLQPTQVTYGTLVSRAGAAGRCDLAVQFYRDALHRGVSPDVQTCNSLINAFAKAADAKRAASVVKSMRRRSLRPTLVTYNSLLDAAARAGNLTLADEALREMADDVRAARARAIRRRNSSAQFCGAILRPRNSGAIRRRSPDRSPVRRRGCRPTCGRTRSSFRRRRATARWATPSSVCARCRRETSRRTPSRGRR